MSGETEAAAGGEANQRIVFEVDHDVGRMPSLFAGGWRDRANAFVTVTVIVAATLLEFVRPSFGWFLLGLWLAADVCYSVRRIATNRLRDDELYIEHGVLVYHRPPFPTLRLPLSKIEGVGVDPWFGDLRRVAVLSGHRVHSWPFRKRLASTIANRIAQEAGGLRVAKSDLWPSLMHHLGFAYLLVLVAAPAILVFSAPPGGHWGWSVLVAGLCAVAGVMFVWFFAERRRQHWYDCRKCKYDLRGIPDPRCPECGEYQ